MVVVIVSDQSAAPSGSAVLRQIFARVKANALRGALIGVAACVPSGAAVEPWRRALFERVGSLADVVLEIHCAVRTRLGVNTAVGSLADPLARRLARWADPDVLVDASHLSTVLPTRASLALAMAERAPLPPRAADSVLTQACAVTLCLGDAATAQTRSLDAVGNALLYMHMLGTPLRLDDEMHLLVARQAVIVRASAFAADGSDAAACGLFEPTCAPGRLVHAGETRIGVVTNAFGLQPVEVICGVDGVLISITNSAELRHNDFVALIGVIY